jgi:hypothetical protein
MYGESGTAHRRMRKKDNMAARNKNWIRYILLTRELNDAVKCIKIPILDDGENEIVD